MERRIYNGIPWYGQNGNTVNAHGVCVIQEDASYCLEIRGCLRKLYRLDQQESVKVRFRIEGAAEILAVDAGDITGSEPYQEDSVHMFHGQASVTVSLTGEPGRICVYADAEGMRTGRQVILAGRYF